MKGGADENFNNYFLLPILLPGQLKRTYVLPEMGGGHGKYVVLVALSTGRWRRQKGEMLSWVAGNNGQLPSDTHRDLGSF